ncbi:hypothetical protein Pyrde_0721 [Pyrodictium delaneyi]|uniref:Uncharacterized protein n=1 Tax=Pyrodictium delaneyi TaxID=1273541 RepID=A0A0P0N2K3_9CREN|nr:hypothetical protein [Pyrodictium delaneyi]ALL00771.1 hypothetical protein Pyrde_0721 [Pyrodictium delaneyi]
MPLLGLRRRKEEPQATDDDIAIELTEEQLKRAEPLPHFADDSWGPGDYITGWVTLNAEIWKPRRNPAAVEGRPLKKPIEINGYPYGAAIFMDDGRIFLVDIITFNIMAEADGSRPLNDIIAKLVAEIAEEDEWVREKLEKNDKEFLTGFYSMLYRSTAMLKERGLLY